MALRPTFKRKWLRALRSGKYKQASGALRRQWLRALRSGKYKQASGALRRRVTPRSGKFGYCCLGVALDVLGGEWTKVHGEYSCQVGRVNNESTVEMNEAVLERIGMTDSEQQVLIRMNDGDGRTFEQIADFVEENL
jgi:hypothetical protein